MRSPASWQDINWHTVDSELSKLQSQMQRLLLAGEHRNAKKFRRVIFSSLATRLKAVKRPAQENRGRQTPGVDGLADLSEEEKLELALDLHRTTMTEPYLGKTIPKRKGGCRDMGIPVMAARAKQTLLKLTLEPELRLRLHPHLYGGISGGGMYDALETIARYIYDAPKYAIVADIENFFPSVSWNRVLEELDLQPSFRAMIEEILATPTLWAGVEQLVVTTMRG